MVELEGHGAWIIFYDESKAKECRVGCLQGRDFVERENIVLKLRFYFNQGK